MAVASAYRRRLADETGLDPGPGLPSLEREIAAGTLLAVPAPAPMRAQTRRRTIVRPSGPMVGRERDAEELHRLLASYPVVTVTGPGGVGKTRLALDVAAALGERDTGDAVLVTLAAIAEARRVPDGVASTLGLRLAGETTPTGVADTLAGEQMLLVLDNCEHVVSACRELVTALRSRAPGVRVLATSRVSLHAPGEFVIRLQPLPLPRDDTDHEGLARQPSVQAFVEHARRRRSGFTLSRTDAGPVVEVIRRLDGLPLAIELAAGQLAVMPVEALRDRLGRALDALSADRPEDDSRHRTLRTTVSWSYRLLAPGERALLRALAPFPVASTWPPSSTWPPRPCRAPTRWWCSPAWWTRRWSPPTRPAAGTCCWTPSGRFCSTSSRPTPSAGRQRTASWPGRVRRRTRSVRPCLARTSLPPTGGCAPTCPTCGPPVTWPAADATST
jgi:hypothetical protein